MFELIFFIVRAIVAACRGHHDLVLENIALRQQARSVQRARRPHLRTRDRMFWVLLAPCLGGVAVRPRRRATRDRDPLASRVAPPLLGAALRSQRLPLDPELRRLIVEMATANPLWGAPRIHGELRTLGMHISERTMSRLLARLSRPPSQTWRTFLGNHLAAFASMDFFTVRTLTGRLLFVFIVLSHDRRRILHVNCTARPTSAWTAQQIVEAFPDDTAPRWLLRDRDNIYDERVRRRIASLGITEVVSSPRVPARIPMSSA